jgi:hypothetical protein
LGKHELQYVYAPEPETAPPARRRIHPRHVASAAIVLVSVLAIACTGLLLENRRLRAAAPPPLPHVWQTFLAGKQSTLIVVPSPLYFYWPEQRVYLRDLAISTFVEWPKSPAIRSLSEQWGQPELAQAYVGAMEMTGGVRLLQFLDRHSQEAQLTESRKFSTESFDRHNTIFLGMPRTTAGYLDRLLEKTNFHLASVSPDVVRSRAPAGGEQTEFRETGYSAERRVFPAILAFLPKRPGGTRSIIVLGRNLLGVTSMLLSPEGLAQIEQQVASHGSPDAWEMVIESEIYRDAILKARPVAFRSIDAQFWTAAN